MQFIIDKNLAFEFYSCGAPVIQDLGDLEFLSARATSKRKEDFLTGRFCARKALEKLVQRQVDKIPVGNRGAPVWPSGVVGSISHTLGLYLAVVGLEKNFKSVGIDCESREHFLEDSGLDLDILVSQGLSQILASQVLFSIQESIFKCLDPLSQTLSHLIDIDLKNFSFSSNEIQGYFTWTATHVVSLAFMQNTEY